MCPRPSVRPKVLVEGVLDGGLGEVVAAGDVGWFPNEGCCGRRLQNIKKVPYSMVVVARASYIEIELPPDHCGSQSTRPASGPRRPTLAPTTSRTLSGGVETSVRASRRRSTSPVASWRRRRRVVELVAAAAADSSSAALSFRVPASLDWRFVDVATSA